MTPAIQTLLTWYRGHKRDLPWRNTRDPYCIFISELMLQQTQVDRVIPKYHAWIKRFPSWKRLAESKTAELIHAWAGLGYNRRALYAREAAREVVRNGTPTTEEGWRTLKGVGPYMAAALTEFANHRRAIVIDTNVRRVAGRVFLGIPFPHLTDDPKILRVLDKVTPKNGAHWNLPQAFMDLGSSVCIPNNPQCAVCPLQQTCLSAPTFLKGPVQRPKRRKATERIHGEKPHPDRIYRGKILALVREHGAINLRALGPKIDRTYDEIADADWIEAMANRLVKDKLLVWKNRFTLSLPQS